jgi:hypothetical protein
MIKNTTTVNYSANDLLNKIIEAKRAKGGTYSEMAYPFASGVLVSIMDDVLRNGADFQKEINSNYHFYSKELAWAKQAA